MSAELFFTFEEYQDRLSRAWSFMSQAGVDVIIVSDPSNMNWLTGYDGWSFYVHQAVILPLGGVPIWWGRGMDAKGALRTVWMDEEQVVGYADHYVQSTERHPMQDLAGHLVDLGLGHIVEIQVLPICYIGNGSANKGID